jgi:beta-glucosidase
VILLAAAAAAAAGCSGSKGAATGPDGAAGQGDQGGDAGAGAGGAAPVCAAAAGGSGGAASAGDAPACQSNPSDYPYPFWDPCAPLEDRITNLLATLTVDEKETLLSASHPAVPRLNLPAASLGIEGLHGLGQSLDPSSTSGTVYIISTQFPQAFGLGESWDPDVTRAVGDTVGHELRIYNAHGISTTGRSIGVVMRAPNVDIVHDPRWGRTEESYGEDPFLIGELAKGYLAALHGGDPKYLQAASTLKHWMANSNETTRLTSSSNLDDRNLREYYAPSFETSVRAGRADAIMTAYNQVNGIPAAVQPLLKSMVIGQWGFDGFFSTDGQTATILVSNQKYYPTINQSIAAIIQGGTGVLLQNNAAATVTATYAMGLITEADMDAALRSALRVRFRLGDFDPTSYVPYKQIDPTATPWLSPETQARALDVTHKTVVLLKNANGTLPLDRGSIGSVAVIGPRADSVVRDWYGGTPPYTVTPRQGITNKLGPGVTINYAADDTGGAATAAAAMSDVALVFVGNHPTCGDPPPPWGTCPSQYEGREQVDRVHITLEPSQLALVQSVAAANPRTIVVLVSSFPIGIGWIDANVPAIVHITNSNQELGNAVADVLFGDYNPAGRTTTTWYQSEADIPNDITDYDITKGNTYWYFAGAPLYPFGYGLSYSTFSYANLTVSAPSVSASGAPGSCAAVDVGVDVTNTSAVAGDEVVQLYVAHPGSDLVRPIKQLRGFRRVSIDPGATTHVDFTIGVPDLTYYDSGSGAFAVETGKIVELQVGASSADIRLRGMLGVDP